MPHRRLVGAPPPTDAVNPLMNRTELLRGGNTTVVGPARGSRHRIVPGSFGRRNSTSQRRRAATHKHT
jgi:hypothetical protein